jgi:hypothetical protein
MCIGFRVFRGCCLKMHDLAMWRAERLIRRSQMRAINLNLNVDLSFSRSILLY